MLDKILRVTRTEYGNIVRTKAFLVSVVLMPVFMGGSIGVQAFLKDRADTTPRRVAVVDAGGEFYAVLTAAAEQRNTTSIFVGEGPSRRQSAPRFEFERVESSELELSERVRRGELFAFLLIGDDPYAVGDSEAFRYHTATPTFMDLPRWTSQVLTQHVVTKRFEKENLDAQAMQRLAMPVTVREFGLATAGADGRTVGAREVDMASTFFVPLGGMLLLFMLVMMAAPALLNSVLEEKMQKIVEVLVASVSPFELFSGKLLGTVLVSWTLSFLYLGGITAVVQHAGYGHLIQPATIGWFLVLQFFALLIFGSLFSALGAACSEIRDAQSMMMPAMLLVMIPMLTFTTVLKDPGGVLARSLTFFPPSTPFILLLRVLTPPGPSGLEVVVAFALMAAFTVLVVWAAGRIFRVGLLSTGQTPTFRQLLSWVTVR